MRSKGAVMTRRTTKRPSMGDKITELEARLAREVEERRKYAVRVHELENLPKIADKDRYKRLGEICDRTLALLGIFDEDEDAIVPALERIRKALGASVSGTVEHAVDNLKEIEAQAERSDAECDAAHERETELEAKLSAALDDRQALLKHAGLGEMAWCMLGGAHPAHLEAK